MSVLKAHLAPDDVALVRTALDLVLTTVRDLTQQQLVPHRPARRTWP